MNNYIYIHIACINNYKDVFNEIMFKIKDSKLYDIVSEIRCGILGVCDDITIFNDPKVVIRGQSDNLLLYESFTINLILDDAMNNDFNVLYLHTKGVTKPNNIYVKDWMEYLCYFNIYRHKECLELLYYNDAVGVNLLNKPTWHYNGNIWWSKSTYIKNLKKCTNITHNSPEFWLSESQSGKYICIWNSYCGHYNNRYPAELYNNKSINPHTFILKPDNITTIQHSHTRGIFIVRPHGGLCNQLQTITKSILLGQKYNRDIYIYEFHTNVYNANKCAITEVLNLTELNCMLTKLNININVLTTLHKDIVSNIKPLYGIESKNIPRLDTLNNIIDMPENRNTQYLDIGNPVSLCLRKGLDLNFNDFSNSYHNIMCNMPFHTKFYDFAKSIKSQLNLTDYICIHLRIEDDAIDYYSSVFKIEKDVLTNKLLQFYTNQIEQEKDRRIYICTGLLYFNNTHNTLYKSLKTAKTNIVDKTDFKIDEYYTKNRELLAIVDYIIARDATKFVGWGFSSFSILLHVLHKNKDNPTELFSV